ncbi:MAG: V-type ATP synthase subunit F [Oscillospiraceae bacterium]|nr:V-type ATP synthase subunit F [Oscillospiraceae bacterium]
MRLFVISDNSDTLVGLRLAGIDGVRVSQKKEVRDAIAGAIADPGIGILLITEKLAAMYPDMIYDLKIRQTSTLVVEIPDRSGTGRTPDSITRYVRDAIGVKV